MAIQAVGRKRRLFLMLLLNLLLFEEERGFDGMSKYTQNLQPYSVGI
jgi:hypothetical protein